MIETIAMGRRLPRHVGIIMDGNGRWATRRGLPRVAGHRAGARAVRRIVEAAARLGLGQLTLYAFSTENWSRPPAEVSALMRLLAAYLRRERGYMVRNDIRLITIGRLGELPRPVCREIKTSIMATKSCAGMTLCLAINYGARSELVDACRVLAGRAAEGLLRAGGIGEADITSCLYQSDMPPLDLIIRTAGECRLSNFLLWQAAYAELWVTPVTWPDFNGDMLLQAVDAFGARERKFGGLPGGITSAPAVA